MRLIEITFPEDYGDEVRDALKECDADFSRMGASQRDGMCSAQVFYTSGSAQDLVDRFQDMFENEDDWRLLVYPIEATAPKPDADEAAGPEEKNNERALREEIYDDVADGAGFSSNFLVLTLASTIVAAIGLNSDNVPAVIGAMVIAPLLGPILAFSLGTTLGDVKLISKAGRNAIIGMGIGMAGAAIIGLFMDLNLESDELTSRIVVGLDSVALALAAGAAAALSVVAGVSAALVGVMVAAALLPPAAAAGLFMGAGEFTFAARSLLLLAVNIICVMLAAQGVYFWKQVRPRTWLEKRSAAKAIRINLIVLGALLAAAIAIIVFAPTEVIPDNILGDAVDEVTGGAQRASEGEGAGQDAGQGEGQREDN